MKITSEFLATCNQGKYVLFLGGKVYEVIDVFTHSKEVYRERAYVSFDFYVSIYEQYDTLGLYRASAIKEPTDQSSALIEKLSQIEVKSKTCANWFDELGAGQLKDAINARKDETFINDKAISLIDAIELSCFLEVGDPDSDYLRRVIQDNKSVNQSKS